MMKSIKPERDAIKARLQEALAKNSNSDIEATLNIILDLEQVESMFLHLHSAYEKLFIIECKELITSRGPNSKVLENSRYDFVREFNKLADLFSNHSEVQRRKKDTDSLVSNISSGSAFVIRGGVLHGIRNTLTTTGASSIAGTSVNAQNYSHIRHPSSNQHHPFANPSPVVPMSPNASPTNNTNPFAAASSFKQKIQQIITGSKSPPAPFKKKIIIKYVPCTTNRGQFIPIAFSFSSFVDGCTHCELCQSALSVTEIHDNVCNDCFRQLLQNTKLHTNP